MDKDRTEICRIISEMLDNPDKCGIYPTSEAYTKLEHYVERVRAEAIGWMHVEACVTLDKGGDSATVCNYAATGSLFCDCPNCIEQ